jgi:PAS domain S-box-containing protein
MIVSKNLLSGFNWLPNRARAVSRGAQDKGANPAPSLSHQLGLLTLLVALPMILVSFVMVGELSNAERQARRAFLVAAAHSLAGAVDKELDKYFVLSSALSHSSSLQQENLTAFAETARETLLSLPGASIIISTPEGRPLLDTARPDGPGRDLRSRFDPNGAAFASGASLLSDIVGGSGAEDPIAAVETPIFRDGKPLYEMTLTVSPRHFSELLQNQAYPPGWIAAIVDRTGKIVARAPEGDGHAGTLATEAFRSAMQRDSESTLESASLEGARVISAYTRIGYGWTISVGVGTKLLDGPVYRALWTLGLLAAASLVASFALSYFVNRRLAFGVQSLQKTASDIGGGKVIAPRSTGVREFDELSLAFSDASSLLSERSAQRQAAETERSASEERFRVLADSLPLLVWTAGPDGRVDYTNAQVEKYGKAGLRRTDWDGVIHPEDLRGTVAAWLKASESGEPYQMEHRLMVIGEGYAWHLSRAAPVRDASGNIVKWYGTTTDIHEHKQREEHIRVLMTEVDHRSKNLLAVTQAIARQTVSSSVTASEFEQKFSGRLLGLAASQDLLTSEKWRGVRLDAVVRSQTDHHSDRESGRILIQGPDIALDSTATQAIGMALHELSTNAAKYGALSNEGGHVELRWRIDSSAAEPTLEMEWIERGGPPVEPPSSRGFGSTVIDAMVSQRLNGVVRLSFEPEGLTWRLTVPLKNVVASDDFGIGKPLANPGR